MEQHGRKSNIHRWSLHGTGTVPQVAILKPMVGNGYLGYYIGRFIVDSNSPTLRVW